MVTSAGRRLDETIQTNRCQTIVEITAVIRETSQLAREHEIIGARAPTGKQWTDVSLDNAGSLTMEILIYEACSGRLI